MLPKILISHWTCLAILLLAPAPSVAQKLDLEDPAQRLEAYVRVVGDASGKPALSYATGTVYGYLPGEKPRALFSLEVVGMGRFIKTPDGYQRLHREVGIYTDLATGEVLTRWFNPYLQRNVEVLHIQNDPVNRRLLTAQQTFKIMQSDDELIFYREVPLRYPNVLTRAEYPLYSSGDFYEAMEMFNDYASLRDLANRKLTAVPSRGSWSRIGPWLPWMEMGATAGHLVYHSRGIKPVGNHDPVPPKIRAYIAAKYPKFLQAPTELSSPDETSWTFFKKHIDAQRAKR